MPPQRGEDPIADQDATGDLEIESEPGTPGIELYTNERLAAEEAVHMPGCETWERARSSDTSA